MLSLRDSLPTIKNTSDRILVVAQFKLTRSSPAHLAGDAATAVGLVTGDPDAIPRAYLPPMAGQLMNFAI